MGILGITNRSENWRTALYFAPLFTDDSALAALANQLLEPLGETQDVEAGTVKIELFWYGMRDYMRQSDERTAIDPKAIAASYEKPYLFRDLRNSINSFRAEEFPYEFKSLQTQNYNVSEENFKGLLNNTQIEIDIVMESPNHLFIGEAKHEEDGFEPYGSAVLVHQLVRQYVTAKILLDLMPCDKQVVPFVVGDLDKLASLQNTVQAKFMISQCWLSEQNVLSWDCIKKITNPETRARLLTEQM